MGIQDRFPHRYNTKGRDIHGAIHCSWSDSCRDEIRHSSILGCGHVFLQNSVMGDALGNMILWKWFPYTRYDSWSICIAEVHTPINILSGCDDNNSVNEKSLSRWLKQDYYRARSVQMFPPLPSRYIHAPRERLSIHRWLEQMPLCHAHHTNTLGWSLGECSMVSPCDFLTDQVCINNLGLDPEDFC